jgi:hypothetical protein
MLITTSRTLKKIRLIKDKAMSSAKKIYPGKEDFGAGVYLPQAQNPITPPPLTHCISVYSIPIHTGKGGEELNQTEGYRGATVHKAQKYLYMTDCFSICQL